MRALVLAAVLALTASPTLAQGAGTSLTLVNADNAPARTIIDNATWRCDAGVCVATGGSNQPAVRACRRVVARLGAVSAFSWKGQDLSAEQLAECNVAAA